MKRRGVILAFACMVLVAAVASGAPKSVSVAPGVMTDALESLAKQYGVDVIYPSGLVKGRATGGVSGHLEPGEAFGKLLEGTGLVLRQEAGALLITRAESGSGPAVVPDPLDSVAEIQIEASREKLSEMRAELTRLEDQFYAAYNRVNDIREYQVSCERVRQGSADVHVCRPMFQMHSEGVADFSSSYSTNALKQPAVLNFAHAPPTMRFLLTVPDYQKHILDVANKHPELLELLNERRALAARYDVARRTKLKGKLFVWD